MTDTDAAEILTAFARDMREHDGHPNPVLAITYIDNKPHQVNVAQLAAVLAENRQLRQQVAALHTEWAAAHPREGWTDDCVHDEMRTEDAARRMAAHDGWYPLRRLVGDWQRADGEQP